MKSHRFILAGACLLNLLSMPLPAAPMVFKVETLVDSREESLDRPRTYFKVGDRRMCFATPPGCELSDSEESLSLYLSKSHASGQVTVTNSPFKPTIDLYANVDDYVRVAQAGIPADAEEVDFKGGSDSIYKINRWKSNALEWTYKWHGRQFRRQVAFINIDKEHQVCLTVVSDEVGAAAAIGAARGFVNSWFFGDLM